MTAIGIELPYQRGVAGEGLRRCEFGGFMLSPPSTCTTEGLFKSVYWEGQNVRLDRKRLKVLLHRERRLGLRSLGIREMIAFPQPSLWADDDLQWLRGKMEFARTNNYFRARESYDTSKESKLGPFSIAVSFLKGLRYF